MLAGQDIHRQDPEVEAGSMQQFVRVAKGVDLGAGVELIKTRSLGTRDRGWSHQTRLTLSVTFREYKGKNRLLLRAAQTAGRN